MHWKNLLDKPEAVLQSWPHEPLLNRHGPSKFDELVTLAEVERLIEYDCLPMHNLRLVKGGKVVAKTDYSEGDILRRGALRQHLAVGDTLQIRSIETLLPSIRILCDDLRVDTGYETRAHAFLTPPGRRGLHRHYDSHVTLVLQIAGHKVWPVYRPFVKDPVRNYQSFPLMGFTREQEILMETTAPYSTYILKPGDVLWLPRGWIHSPYTERDESSLHITVNIIECTNHRLAEMVAQAALRKSLADDRLRLEIPPAQMTGDPIPVIKEVRGYLIGALEALDAEEIAAVVREELRRS